MNEESGTDTLRAVVQAADLALDEAASQAGLPSWVLPHLVAVERRRTGRFGTGGINTKFAEAIERLVDGRKAPPSRSGGQADSVASAPEVRLRWIELKNFRQFAAARIEFSQHPARPICVIEADNGHGKSNLVEALRWVFVEYRHPVAGPAALLHRYVVGAKAEVRVRVAFDVEGEDVEVWRRQDFVRRSTGFVAAGPPSLTLRLADGKAPLQDREAEDWLAGRLPPEVLGYFLFDAESTVVQELSGQAGERLPEVRTQVEAAVGAQPARAAERRCRDLARGWKKEANGLSDVPVSALDERLVALEAEAEGLQVALAQAQAEAAQEQARIDEIVGLVGAGTVADAERRGERRGAERARLAQLRGLVDEGRQRLRSSLNEDLALAVLAPALPTAGRAPARPGRDVEESIERIAELVAAGRFAWATATPAGRVRADLTDALGYGASEQPLAEIAERAFAASRRLAGIEALPALEDELARLEARLLEGDPPAEDGRAALSLERAECEARRDGALRRSAEAQTRLEAIDAERESSKGERRRAQRAAGRQASILGKAQAAERVAVALGLAADRIRDEGLRTLERSASRALASTTNKPELFAGIRFEPRTLRYSVVDHDGNPVPPDPSTGERTVLALALVTGLQRASGLRFPLIMEAVFKPLGPLHQDNVVRLLLIQRQEQTLLLLKPGELPPTLQHLIDARIGQRFAVRRPHPKRNVSELVEVRS